MVVQFLLSVTMVWVSIGWIVVGAVTLRNVDFFRRINVVMYLLGGVVTAMLWPTVVTSLLFNPRPRRFRDRKPNRTTR